METCRKAKCSRENNIRKGLKPGIHLTNIKNKGKESENCYQKLKRSPQDRRMKT
jgi:hypothetical protein